MDRWLFIIGLLLAVTLTAFFAGVVPYPFGIIVLVVLFVARWLHTSGR